MSVAEGYSISVQCDGTHEPGLVPQGEVYGHTKREAHAELRRAGWRLGPDFTAYCKRCKVPRTAGVTASQGQAIGADTPMGKPE